MAKSDDAEKKVRRAQKTAKVAVADAARLVDLLSKKRAQRLAASADDLNDAVKDSQKHPGRHPKKTRERIEKATRLLEQRMRKARAKLRSDAADPAFGARTQTGDDSDATAARTADAHATSAAASSLDVSTPDAERDPAAEADSPTPPTRSDSTPAVDAATLAAAQAAVLPTADLSSLTVFELRRRAKESGRVGYSGMTKAQLVALLTT